MTQVTPAANHPLRIQSEMPRFKKSVDRQNKSEQQVQLKAQVLAFINAGGLVEVLPGFPEIINSQAAQVSSWMLGR
jgi:hypothetical protein